MRTQPREITIIGASSISLHISAIISFYTHRRLECAYSSVAPSAAVLIFILYSSYCQCMVNLLYGVLICPRRATAGHICTCTQTHKCINYKYNHNEVMQSLFHSMYISDSKVANKTSSSKVTRVSFLKTAIAAKSSASWRPIPFQSPQNLYIAVPFLIKEHYSMSVFRVIYSWPPPAWEINSSF